MKLLYDFLPIALFFVAYKLGDIFVATGVAIAAALVQVGLSWVRHRRIEPLHLISAGLIGLMGGATLLLHDKSFIMWKPTLVYVLFAGVFAASQLFGRRPLIQRLLGAQLRMPDAVWRRLGWVWVVFFIGCGAANAGLVEHYARAEDRLRLAASPVAAGAFDDLQCQRDFSPAARELCREAADREALWVNFKLFGLLGITLLFILGQTLWLARHAEPVDNDDEGDPQCSTRS